MTTDARPERVYGKYGISLPEYQALRLRSYPERLKLSLPSNDAELAVVSEYIFGWPLHLCVLNVHGQYGSYEVEQNHDAYYDHKFSESVHQSSYEVDRAFWATVIGPLFCGGIARASYGQVHVTGHRQRRRLAAWQHSRRSETGNTLRPAFARLAAHCRARRERNDSR